MEHKIVSCSRQFRSLPREIQAPRERYWHVPYFKQRGTVKPDVSEKEIRSVSRSRQRLPMCPVSRRLILIAGSSRANVFNPFGSECYLGPDNPFSLSLSRLT